MTPPIKPTYQLTPVGTQRRSAKAEQYAVKLAMELRDLTGVGSAHGLAKYHTIDSLKDALWHVKNGYEVIT